MTRSETQAPPRQDVIIAGGGPVGATLALALADAGLRVALIERRAVAPASAGDEQRPIAVAEGSRRILQTLDVWSSLADHGAPIRHIHVSDRGHFGSSRLHASEHGVDTLGHVTDATTLTLTLAKAVRARPGITVLSPAAVAFVEQGRSVVRCGLEASGESAEGLAPEVSASLLVVADGGRSALRDMAGFAVRERDYGQCAITAVVTPRHAHRDTAFERFTEHGPLALLPLAGRRCGLVWSRPPALAEALMTLPEEAFLQSLTECFGQWLGGFEAVGERALHPLSRTRVTRTVAERMVLVGNAAHVLHPVAGQGLNLGLRDAAWLAESLAGAHRAGTDPGERALLERYAAARGTDQRATGLLTDLLVGMFSNRWPPLVLARGIGLKVLDLSAPLKHLFVRQAMGLAGRQPRLARGLPA